MSNDLQAKALVERLVDTGDEFDLMSAARALAALGPEARAATPELLAILKEDGGARGAAAAFVLSEIGERTLEYAPNLLDTLIEKLYHENGEIRHWITVAIARMGSLASSAVPHLVDSLEDPDEGVRLVSAHALGELGEAAHDALLPLIRALNDSSDGVRLAAACALPKVDPAGRACVEALVRALVDASPSVRCYAAEAIGVLGDLGAPAVPRLIQCLSDPDTEVRFKAANSLGKTADRSEGVLRGLALLLQDKDANVRCEAANALQKLRASAAVAPQLIAAVSDNDEMVRYHVVEALEAVSPSCPELTPAITVALSHCLRDASPLVQSRAVTALGSMSSHSPDVEDTLLKSLLGNDLEVRISAITVLAKRHGRSDEVRRALEACIADRHPKIRITAACALIKAGQPESQLLHIIARELDHADGATQIVAIKALSEIANKAEAAIPSLELKLETPNAIIRSLARDAIERIQEESQKESRQPSV